MLTNDVLFVYISSDCIVFVTEPVFCSLANVLGNYENLPSPLPLCIKVWGLCVCTYKLYVCVCVRACILVCHDCVLKRS